MSENLNRRRKKEQCMVEQQIQALANPNLNSEKRNANMAAIERAKILDPEFGKAINDMEEEWLGAANAHLKKLFDDAMAVNSHLMMRVKETRTVELANGRTIEVPTLSSEEVVNILTAQRKLMVDVSEQFRLAIGKPTSIHSNITKNDTPSMSDEELDRRIKALSKHLNYIDITPEVPETPDAT